MGADRALWNEYRGTWEAFSRKLDELQAVVETGDRSRAEEALLVVERARLTHNAARDKLAAQLSGEIASMDRQELDAVEQRRVPADCSTALGDGRKTERHRRFGLAAR